MPKNLVTVSLSICKVMPSMNNSQNFVGKKRFLEMGWKIVYLVLSILMKSLFALNQVETIFSALFICWNSFTIISYEISKFVSSAHTTFHKVEIIHIN